MPRAPALPEWRRSLPVSGLHHSGPRLTAVRWGRESIRSEGLGRTTTRRSESSARPPRKRRCRLQHRYRPALRAQRVEGPPASHAARRQRLAASAPPSLSAHWQTPPPLYIRPVIPWTTGLLKPNVRAVFGRLGLSLFQSLPYLCVPALHLSGAGCVCVCLCVCVCVSVCPRSPGSTGLGLGVGQPPGLPEACQGSPTWRPDSHLVSWKPNPEATQACGGSRGPGHPPGEGPGLRGPKSWAGDASERAGCEGPGAGGARGANRAGRPGLKERRGRKPTAPGMPRRYPTQVLTRPDPASLPRSDKIRRVQSGMALDGGGCSQVP